MFVRNSLLYFRRFERIWQDVVWVDSEARGGISIYPPEPISFGVLPLVDIYLFRWYVIIYVRSALFRSKLFVMGEAGRDSLASPRGSGYSDPRLVDCLSISLEP